MSRVLLVNDRSDVGGGTTAMLDVARVLVGDGFEVHVAAPAGVLLDGATALGATVHPTESSERRMLTGAGWVPRPQAVAARVAAGRALASLADEIGADVVHSGALVSHLDVAAMPAGRWRTLWHLHQLHPAALAALPLPDRIVSVSAAAARPVRWRRAARRRLGVIPNGVDLTRFRPPDTVERKQARRDLGLDDELVVATVARLEPEKGVEAVLRGAPAGAVVLVVGDGPDERRLRSIAARSGIDARFLGVRHDVESVLWAADVFALGSTWEAFGLVVVEAAATGLPVVVTRACAEVVRRDLTALVTDAAGMPDALGLLAARPDLRERFGRAGRRLAEQRFDLADLGGRLLPIHRELAR